MALVPPTPRKEVLANIQAYLARVSATEHPPPIISDVAAAEVRLDQTLADLESRIAKERVVCDALHAEQGTALRASHSLPRETTASPLQSIDGPSSDSFTRLRQIRAVTRAYRQLVDTEPALPLPNSSLPGLLALQATANDNASIRQCIADTYAELRTARERLATERRELRENGILQKALQTRVNSLRATSSTRNDILAQQKSEDIVRKRIEVAGLQRKSNDAEARKCTKALVRFVNQTLAPMLAAEELGGPVAGMESSIDEDNVRAGFNAQGRVKKTRPSVAAAPGNEEAHVKQQRLRQQRIDAIWGPAKRATAEDFADDETDHAERSEVEVAAQEVRDLVQKLLEAATQPRSSASPYVRLARDSAAARFLVRSNVAVLHRTDARRIRLQDFGRSVDD